VADLRYPLRHSINNAASVPEHQEFKSTPRAGAREDLRRNSRSAGSRGKSALYGGASEVKAEKTLVRGSARSLARSDIQKALNEMNLHLHHVLSDISGQSGLAILNAILTGARPKGGRSSAQVYPG